MTEQPKAKPPIDTSRHYPETRKRDVPGVWMPYCPRCNVQWPCPSAPR